MTIATKIYTALHGTQVGFDDYGTKYYIAKKPSINGAKKRWAIYKKGWRDASIVPPNWHAWLHYVTDDIPTSDSNNIYDWQQPHMPNMTGTPLAYFPKGHLLSEKPQAFSDYEAWQPDE
ncbi:MAG: NADH-ubiquinone oxidoreductase subunit NDUFA12 family protein [Pseudomonadota bacterium]